MRNMINRLIPAVLLVVVGIVGCGESPDDNNGKLRVVATTGMIADAVKEVAGDNVELYSMMGPGVDPHLFKPSKGDIDQLSRADLIFYNGLYLEAKMADVLDKMKGKQRTVAVAEAVPDSLLDHPEGYEGHPDPHVWFDLGLWQLAVDTVGDELMMLDTANAQEYDQHRRALLDSLRALDAWIRESIARIPEENRILVTAHDAFGYFGRAYGIEVRGLQGISTVTEAGLYDVTSMVDMLVERKIPAVFVESSVPRKTIEAVVEGCRERRHDVRIGGELFSDAMGAAGTPEGTYVGMVRHNVNTIIDALKGGE